MAPKRGRVTAKKPAAGADWKSLAKDLPNSQDLSNVEAGHGTAHDGGVDDSATQRPAKRIRRPDEFLAIGYDRDGSALPDDDESDYTPYQKTFVDGAIDISKDEVLRNVMQRMVDRRQSVSALSTRWPRKMFCFRANLIRAQLKFMFSTSWLCNPV